MRVRDVCVIGAGIIGTSVAFQLSKFADIRVTMVDGGYPGAGTTEAGTGWINAYTPDREYRTFRLAAMEEHHRLAAEFPAAPWLTTGGVLRVESPGDDLDAVVDLYRQADMAVEILTAAEVNARLEPHVAFASPDVRVAHFAGEFGVAGSMLARALFQAAVDNGAAGHLGSRVTGLDALPDGRHRVLFEDGTALEADAVVNAAGARADRIAACYDVPMPLLPQTGIGIHVKVEGTPLSRMILADGLAVKPEPDGVLKLRSMLGWITGASERDDGFTGGMERNAFLDHVVNQVAQLLPSARPVRAIATRTGVRPFPADGLPRVGEVDSVPGYFEAVTHSGATVAPLIGRLLAEEIATGIKSPALAAYRPARFLTDAGRPVEQAAPRG